MSNITQKEAMLLSHLLEKAFPNIRSSLAFVGSDRRTEPYEFSVKVVKDAVNDMVMGSDESVVDNMIRFVSENENGRG